MDTMDAYCYTIPSPAIILMFMLMITSETLLIMTNQTGNDIKNKEQNYPAIIEVKNQHLVGWSRSFLDFFSFGYP